MQVVNGSTPFQTPNSGTGAVIFDYPKEQPLDMLLKANDDLDKFYLRKQQALAANKKTTEDLMKGVKLNEAGLMYKDVPEISKLSNQIYENAWKIHAKYNGDLTTPAAQREWIENVQLPQQQAQLLIEGSKHVGSVLDKAGTELMTNYDKHEQEASQVNIASILATPISQLVQNKDKITPYNVLVPKKTDILEKTIKQLTQIPVSENAGSQITLPSGEHAIPVVKARTPEQLNTLATAHYNNTEDREGWEVLYNKEPSQSLTAYKILAGAETTANKAAGSNEVGDPLKYYIQDKVKNLSGKGTTLTNTSYDPTTLERYKTAEENKANEGMWQGLYQAINGNPKAYNTIGTQQDVNGLQVGATANMISTVGTGKPIGTMLVYKPKIADGVFVTNEDGSQVFEQARVPNIHYAIKWKDGKPYAINAQTVYNASVKNGFNPDEVSPEALYEMPDVWVPVDKNYVARFENGGTGTENIKLSQSHNAYLDKKKARANGIVSLQTAAGEDVPPISSQYQTTQKPVTQPKATGKKTVSSATLNGLVGTKGYEGYTLKEIQDYYKSNGYEIK